MLIPGWPAPANVHAFTTLKTSNPDYTEQLPAKPTWLKQVHGTKVVCADNLRVELPEADASIAFQAGTVCVVRTADCLPLLICDTRGTQVAAIHAGWRGLAAGIIAETCKLLSAPPDQCLVWLGPAIGAQAFEVGPDVLESFLNYGWAEEHIQNAFKPREGVINKWLGDLAQLARLSLQQHGILSNNIYGGEWCTYSDPARFDSYRRSADTNRMSSLIYLK